MRTMRKLRAPGAQMAAGALILVLPTSAIALGDDAPDTPANGTGGSGSVHIDLAQARVAYGRDVIVRGHVPAADAGRRLALEFEAAGAHGWRTLAQGTATASGRFTLRARLTRSGQVRVADPASRGVTTTSATTDDAVPTAPPYTLSIGDGTPLPASPGRTVEVGSRFAVAATDRAVLSGSQVLLHGHLLPGAAGRVVGLQARSGGRWVTLARARTGRWGGFTLRYTVASTGGQTLRVSFGGDRRNGPATAPAGEIVGMVETLDSWYDDAGDTACGFHATYGVANRTLPCGTQVTLSYGGRTVVATVDDRGPYVGGREYDLNQNTAQALGMGGVALVEASIA
jgi:rare lipoprotein A